MTSANQQLSRKRQKKLRHHHTELINLLAGIRTPQLMALVLDDLCTPAELQDMANRIQIVKQLARGVDQRTIAEQLGVGIGTVTRGSRALANPKGGFRRVIKV